jgi:hypothetical protein
MRESLVAIVTAVIVFAIVFAAIPHLNAPTWDITIVDGNGNPIGNVQVREEAQDYSCESEAHEVTLTSDSLGHVHFAPQYIHRNPFHCAVETVSELMAFVHGSFGRHAYAFPLGFNASITDDKGNVYDWRGSPTTVKSTLVLK